MINYGNPRQGQRLLFDNLGIGKYGQVGFSEIRRPEYCAPG
jgi:hypothetical protein